MYAFGGGLLLLIVFLFFSAFGPFIKNHYSQRVSYSERTAKAQNIRLGVAWK